MRTFSSFLGLACVVSVLPFVACSGSDDGGDSGSSSGPPAEGPITSLPAGWQEVAPGGSTTCSDGSPFRFWARRGSVNRVVIDFRGGGACWSTLTCSASDSLFQPTATPEPWVEDESVAKGIYDHTRADNPFKDWHHVYVSYCTGDVHWGDATKTYGTNGPTIHHRGAVNAKAALEWTYTQVPNPDKVFVTGCSAGGYGAALWSAYVKQHYANAETYLFADSAAGIITDTFFQESFPAWNATANFPSFLGVDASTFDELPTLYIGLAKTFPEMFVSQFNTNFDATQHTYFAAMGGGTASDWSQKMNSNLTEIATAAPSFRYYVAPDYEHCVINKDSFYTTAVNGEALVDWLGSALGGKAPESVGCGTSCGAPKPE